MDKKSKQLGMSASTAAHRLRVDLLFKFAILSGHKCYHCNGDLVRETFSIEHKKAWLDSADPKAIFFDLDNIAFSHIGCNSANKRHPHQKYFSEDERRAGALKAQREWKRNNYSATARAKKFAERGN
ncbi:hypothetical protein [Herbaspirillum sp.]|uniref:hypothetical protein n=1 Tax=Herbaspirillum sp. TaxID=1890675 RepID=UPI000C09DBEA|nr:hypothetical protein [Herbaspirillum sp.]MAF04412.1 hypothetical protein [Herbaspirillum sp.]MBO18301.1 hypothetical protein [Herbaspirillum sp.]|tara:strand:- start:32973 stop:33353 length:381 start_codon:yes stop_codon:yes gene_type:complete